MVSVILVNIYFIASHVISNVIFLKNYERGTWDWWGIWDLERLGNVSKAIQEVLWARLM